MVPIVLNPAAGAEGQAAGVGDIIIDLTTSSEDEGSGGAGAARGAAASEDENEMGRGTCCG